jgi:hypothetical protein
MKKFWTRGDGLERELRAQRPEPRQEFLRSLESEISGARYRKPSRSLRLGLAGAVTAVMIVSVGAFGGLGYAATGVTHAVKAASHAVAPARKSAPTHSTAPASSAQVQYLVTMCFYKHTIRVDSRAAPILRALGAKNGACGGEKTPPAGQAVFVCIKGQNVRVAPAAATALVRAKKATRGFC